LCSKKANEGILILVKMARLHPPFHWPLFAAQPASKPKVITTKNSQQQQQAVMIIAAMCLPQRPHTHTHTKGALNQKKFMAHTYEANSQRNSLALPKKDTATILGIFNLIT